MKRATIVVVAATEHEIVRLNKNGLREQERKRRHDSMVSIPRAYDIDIRAEDERSETADIFRQLKISRGQPLEPLLDGK